MKALPQRRLQDIFLLIVSLGVGAFAVTTLRQPWAKTSQSIWPWVLLIFASLLGGLALRSVDFWLPDSQPAANPIKQLDPTDNRRKKIGVAFLDLAGLLLIWVIFCLWPNYHIWKGAVAPWVTAMVLVLAGSLFLKTAGQAKKSVLNSQSIPNHPASGQKVVFPFWLEIGGFLLIAVLAVILRTYRLDTIPSGIYVDETNGAMDALAINEGNNASPFATGWYGTPNGYIYYMAFLFKSFGVNYPALKAVSLIPAILSVLAIYPLGRMMFGPLGGLASMLFFAVSRWHLSMSRWGWNEPVPLLFQIGATYFLIRGLREKRAADFALGGLITGLMMYTYLSSRLALATLGIFILYYLLVDGDGPISALKRHSAGLLLFVFAAVVAAAPIAVTHIRDPFTFNNRVNQISIFRDTKDAGSYQPLWLNIQDHLKFFHQVGDHQGKHNLPDEPQTDPFTGLLFVIGLGYGLFNLRDWRGILLWFWLLLGMVGGIFSSNFESPQSYRTLSAVPAIALLAGGVLSRITQTFYGLALSISAAGNSLVSKVCKFSGILLLVVGLGGAGLWESSVYFGRQANSLAVQAGFNLTENQVAQEVIGAIKANTPIYLSPRFYDFSPVRFLVYGLMKKEKGVNVLNNWPFFLIRPEQDLPIPYAGHDAIFLLDTYYLSVAKYIKEYYPNTQITTIQWADQIPLYLKLLVPRVDLEAIQGLSVTYTLSDGRKEEKIVPLIDEDWSQKDIISASWHGYIFLPSSGQYIFQNQGNLSLQLDGQEWRGGKFLCSGLHKISVSQADAKAAGLARLQWSLPSGEEGTIPQTAFFNLSQIPQQGLTGYYYSNQIWQGEPACQKLTPFFLLAWPNSDPFPDAFSARFKGSIRITKPGQYHFRIEADDGARLMLDGKTVGESIIPNQPNQVDVDINLSPGLHPIQIDYFQAGGGSTLELYWQPPGEGETPVPPEVLLPENS